MENTNLEEPNSKDLESLEFNAVWEAIKKWDIERVEGEGYAHATGTDVMIILNAIRPLLEQEKIKWLEALPKERTGIDFEPTKGDWNDGFNHCLQTIKQQLTK
jgi:hypothetical protein